MSQADLDSMERDVETTRARVANDLARLRNPAALSDFGKHVVAGASAIGGELATKASETAAGAGQNMWSDLKARAAANPGAALAIGAGLAWHFLRHPPVTTLLVGLGFTSLMRTDPSTGPSPIVTRSTEFAGRVSETAREWSDDVREAAESASQKTREWGSNAYDTADETLSQVSGRAAQMASDSSRIVRSAFPHDESRDRYLMGVAALAIAAATIISVQRKDD